MLNLMQLQGHPLFASAALLLCVSFAQPVRAQQPFDKTNHLCEPIITTVAGNGMPGYSGDNGPAIEAGLSPGGLAVDHQGNLYIANGGVRRVDRETGIITTVAGNGTPGYSGDGGPATEAQLNASVVALDKTGNLYIAGPDPDVVRRVDKRTGIITTVVGNGVRGYSGDGGPATDAELNFPTGLAVDLHGNLYISDTGNFRVRRVSRRTGIITTVAGNGMLGDRFRRPAGDGGPATEAPLIGPHGLALDSEGYLYFADPTFVNVAGVPSGFIREVDLKTGIISTVNVPTGSPIGVAVDSRDNLYVSDTRGDVALRVDRKTGTVSIVAGTFSRGYSGDGGPATEAKLNAPTYLAFNRTGDLFISDAFNYRVRMVDFDGCRNHRTSRDGDND
jgi:trimeric autotransporter adhesin